MRESCYLNASLVGQGGLVSSYCRVASTLPLSVPTSHGPASVPPPSRSGAKTPHSETPAVVPGNGRTHYQAVGLSLPLTGLVMRHQVSGGCPSAESGTNEECLWTQPAALRPGRGHRRVSRAWDLRVPLFPVEHTPQKHRPSIGVWYSPQAVTSNRNQVSRRYLATTTHHLFLGRPPRPRDASVCPLDNGALIGVVTGGYFAWRAASRAIKANANATASRTMVERISMPTTPLAHR